MSTESHAPALPRLAIVGMAGRFPGAPDIATFWSNLREGIESIAVFTDDELREAGIADRTLQDPRYVKARGVLDDVDLFDAAFFDLTPREADLLDPQHRLFLHCAWHALEDAGCDPARVDGPIGVFAGVGSSGYLRHLDPQVLADGGAAAVALGNDRDFFATRLSYKLDLSGPSLTIQTACSTSLVAVHMACQSLLTGQCDMAIAGGVCVKLPQRAGHLYQEGGIFSRDGHCRAFDAAATGTVGGSGLGCVVLKRLDDAIADGDRIYAQILASAVNNDGAGKVGYTAPSVDGQADVIALAHALAQIDVETIAFVEGHGTGTPLGDPIEIAALTKAFRVSTDARRFCALGSVKTNVGHLDAAAGVAGLIKTALALYHGEIPPTLHFRTPNPASELADGPFYVNAQCVPWPEPDRPRRAGVSSFGIGGTNAHIVLEAANRPPHAAPPEPASSGSSQPWHVVTLSARSTTALDAMTSRFADHVAPPQAAPPLADIAYTTQCRRRAFEYRRVIVGQRVEDVVAAIATGDATRMFSRRCEGRDRPVVFLFPGQGSQRLDMARSLYEHDAGVRQDIDACAEQLAPQLGLDLRRVLYPRPDERGNAARQLGETVLTQPVLFVIEYALARLWMRWGVQPRALLGHSVGEYVAACLADVMSLPDALRLVAARGRLVQSMPAGAMLGVPLAVDELNEIAGEGVSVAAINGAKMVVLSGPEEAIARVEARLADRRVASRRLAATRAFHSAMMEPVLAPFEALVLATPLRAPRIPVISNVTGTWLTAQQATDPHYWGRHLREPVRFADGVAELLRETDRVLLEVGPGRTLTSLVRRHPQCDGRRSVLSSQPAPGADGTDETGVRDVMTTLGRVWLAGVEVDWEAVHHDARRQRVSLPAYPFDAHRHWLSEVVRPLTSDPMPPAPTPPAPRQTSSSVHDLSRNPSLLSGHDFYLPTWTQVPAVAPAASAHSSQLVLGPVLVFLDSRGIGDAGVRRFVTDGRRVNTVSIGPAFANPAADVYVMPADDTAAYQQLGAALDRRDAWPSQIVHLWSQSIDGATGAPPDADTGTDTRTPAFDSLLALARLLGPRAGAAVDLAIVTHDVHEVTGAERLDPIAATVLGPCRVIPREMPHVTCRHIDITGYEDADRSNVEALLEELRRGDEDATVALRNGLRWRPGFVRAPAPASARPPLREGGTYLITGGLGGVGLALAAWLVESARARVALIGRDGLPPRAEWARRLADAESSDPARRVARRIRGVQALDALGAQTLVLQADCLDRAQMAAAIAEVRDRLGPIVGVIHAAGLPGDGLIELKTIEAAHAVMAPKIAGTRLLAELLAGTDLDFLVLCSSLSACLGGVGQVDYAAANAFLDAFAQGRRGRAPRTMAIDWGAWRDVGMAAEARAAAPHQRDRTPGAAEASLSTADGVAAFARALSLGVPRVAVSAVPLDTMYFAARPVAVDAGLPTRGETPEQAIRPATGQATRQARPDLDIAVVAPRTDTEATLAAIWEDVLGLSGIGVDDDFSALGGHSLLATQIVARIRRQFGIDLPLRALFDTPTIAQLASMVIGGRAAQSTESDLEAALARLEEMPDADAVRALTADAPPITRGGVA